MASMDNVGQDHRKIISGRLLKVGLMECAVGIWVSTNLDFCPPKDFGLQVHGFLYGLVQKVGCHGHLRAMA